MAFQTTCDPGFDGVDEEAGLTVVYLRAMTGTSNLLTEAHRQLTARFVGWLARAARRHLREILHYNKLARERPPS